jgi:hypothetical protein
MQDGDCIAILQGAVTPYVLRLTSHERYVLIGEAYVLGIMHGEFMSTGPVIETIEIE